MIVQLKILGTNLSIYLLKINQIIVFKLKGSLEVYHTLMIVLMIYTSHFEPIYVYLSYFNDRRFQDTFIIDRRIWSINI